MRIGIIDYQVNNISSVSNALLKLNIKFGIVNSKSNLEKFSGFILPGVGSFPYGMKYLQENKLNQKIKKQVINKKKPILGICLGMQLFSTFSIENEYCKGMDLISGDIKKINSKKNLKVPIVGWYKVIKKKNDKLFKGIADNSHFFFDHSYHFVCKNKKYICAEVNHKSQKVVASIKKDNIYGIQFHPEKSNEKGLELLNNFYKIVKKKS